MIYNENNLKDIPEKTYGLLGNPVSHSVSPFIHAKLFEYSKIRSEYCLINSSRESLERTVRTLKENLSGFNVTVPYKKDIVPFLDSLDDTAKMLGAVNTVKIENGKATGHNTDYHGFIKSLKDNDIDVKGKRVLILGAGGVSTVFAFALAKLGAKIYIYSKTKDKTNELIKSIKSKTGAEINAIDSASPGESYDMIVNGTPAGMYPEINDSPVSEELIKNCSIVYDSIYNPLSTKLIINARKYGKKTINGLEMLINQAVISNEIWTGFDYKNFDTKALYSVLSEKVNADFPVNIVLIGFMGSGKTFTARMLAEKTGKSFLDLDEIIEKKQGIKISEIFERHGEEYFRKLESSELELALKNKNTVLALGGGAVLSEENRALIKNSLCRTVFLDVKPETVLKRLEKDSLRPLLAGDKKAKINELLGKRMPVYIDMADITVDSNGDVSDTVKDIMNYLGL